MAPPDKSPMTGINWKRVSIAGVAMEVLYIFFVLVILGSAAAANAVPGLIGVFLLMFIGGYWAAGKSGSGSLQTRALMGAVNGILVGIVAVGLYDLIVIVGSTVRGAETQIPVFGLNHALKVIGGATGGLVCGARPLSSIVGRHE